MKIFVITSTVGEYDDAHTSIVCAFTDKSKAEEYVAKLESEFNLHRNDEHKCNECLSNLEYLLENNKLSNDELNKYQNLCPFIKLYNWKVPKLEIKFDRGTRFMCCDNFQHNTDECTIYDIEEVELE